LIQGTAGSGRQATKSKAKEVLKAKRDVFRYIMDKLPVEFGSRA